jgi:hypothetical protein
MTLDLMRITAALNAYPWTAGTLTHRAEGAPKYCAVGLLLRFAGVPQERIACATAEREVWAGYEEILRCEYGIADSKTISAIMIANDSAGTHEKAIQRVQAVLSGGGDSASMLARAAAFRVHRVAPQVLYETGEDDAGSEALLV